MSEAELHQIKIRLHQGERQKAARGELRLPLPAGLVHNRDGSVTFNPDEEVQERLRLVFAKFRELRSAKAVMRYLRGGNLLLPVRPLLGSAPHDVVWRAADSARVVQILKNPAYAGAYVYGRRRPDPLRRQPGSERIGTVAVAPEDWSICLKDAHPAYVDWDEFMANRRQLVDNLDRYDTGRPGAPRKGNALLQGIVSCGRCARRMCLRYSGPNGDYPVYVCVADRSAEGRPKCQEARALAVDAEVERLILEALTPDRIALAVAALGLTGDDGGSAAMAVVDDLQQIAPLLRGEWGQSPVVEDENLGAGEALEHACITSVAARQAEAFQHARHTLIEHRAIVATGPLSERTSEPGLAHAGRTRGILPNITIPMRRSFIGITLATVRAWRS